MANTSISDNIKSRRFRCNSAALPQSTIEGNDRRSIAHELGYTAGWNHDDQGKVIVPNLQLSRIEELDNLMCQTSYISRFKRSDQSKSSRQILKCQFETLQSNYASGNLNKQSPLIIQKIPNGLQMIPGQSPKALFKTLKTLRR